MPIVLILIGSSFFSTLGDWIRYTFRKQNNDQGIKNSHMDSLHKHWLICTNMDNYIPGFDHGTIYWFLTLNKKENNLKPTLLGELWPSQNYQNVPELTQLHENSPNIPKRYKSNKKSPCINLSLRCYVGNIEDCEPMQATKEKLCGMCLVLALSQAFS